METLVILSHLLVSKTIGIELQIQCNVGKNCLPWYESSCLDFQIAIFAISYVNSEVVKITFHLGRCPDLPRYPDNKAERAILSLPKDPLHSHPTQPHRPQTHTPTPHTHTPQPPPYPHSPTPALPTTQHTQRTTQHNTQHPGSLSEFNVWKLSVKLHT